MVKCLDALYAISSISQQSCSKMELISNNIVYMMISGTLYCFVGYTARKLLFFKFNTQLLQHLNDIFYSITFFQLQ